jgi:SWI/SNF-related matrix-associated actin-dependent regulator 1 of chromatin subfamily A
LSGTPIPNSPADAWPMLNALAPERLGGIANYDDFVHRYCVVKMVRFGGGPARPVIKGGKNLEELNERVKGFWLRRTQKDVGIKPPIFSVFALTVDKLPPELRDDPEAQAVLDAFETGETKSLEMHLGPIRRLTGHMKAHAVVAAAKELLEDGQIDKLVLMAWHVDVLDILWTGLAQFGVTGIDGRTGAKTRDAAVKHFNRKSGPRVFVGQITAAGEAIDLSAAAELWFVEQDFVPKSMSQAAMRVCNHSQKRQALVRVCALAGSIDEAMAAILTRKVASIRELMK